MKKTFVLLFAVIVAAFGFMSTGIASASEGDDLAVQYACMLSDFSTDDNLFTDPLFTEQPAYRESVYHKQTNMYRMGASIQFLWLDLKRRGDKIVSYAGGCDKALANIGQ